MMPLVGLAKWWSSARSSNTLVIVIAAFAIMAVAYVQQLRVKVAACEGNKAAMEQVERLSKRIVDHEEEKRDEALEEIDSAEHPCLDVRSVDILRGD